MALNKRIAEALKHFNKSRNEFASYAGVSHQYVSSIINGKSNPGLTPINKLLEFIPELNANWLLKGQGEIAIDLGKQEKGEAKERESTDLRVSLENCQRDKERLWGEIEDQKKDKERAWQEVEYLRSEVNRLREKEAS